VEAIGGRFTLVSGTGQGTTVVAAIPATPAGSGLALLD
jgi:signal transduction histidine kinase